MFYDDDSKIADFVKEYPNIIPDDVCDDLVSTFERAKDIWQAGEITDAQGYNKIDKEVKNSFDIMITGYPEFKNADKLMHKYALKALHKYLKDVPLFEISAQGFAAHNPDDQYLKFETMKLRKYPKGGFFKSHIDTVGPTTMDRLLAMIMYLNDVEEGGETRISGTPIKTKCEKGKILIKPCSWLVMHESNRNLSGPKYIGVTFVRPIFLH